MKTFIILGMHRSATSLAAKGLLKAGVNMGQVLLGAGRGNEYGHFEDVEFIKLNDRILSAACGSWDCPPPIDAIENIKPLFDEEIRALLKRKYTAMSDQGLIGWKDPRTVLTISLYIDYLINPHFITIWRDKMDVAMSLNKRDGMPVNKGIGLAEIYNSRLLMFLNQWNNGFFNGINNNTGDKAEKGFTINPSYTSAFRP